MSVTKLIQEQGQDEAINIIGSIQNAPASVSGYNMEGYLIEKHPNYHFNGFNTRLLMFQVGRLIKKPRK